jgi:hypothetical protein
MGKTEGAMPGTLNMPKEWGNLNSVAEAVYNKLE